MAADHTSMYSKLGNKEMADLEVLQPLDIDDQLGAILGQGEQVNIPNTFLFFLQTQADHTSAGTFCQKTNCRTASH